MEVKIIKLLSLGRHSNVLFLILILKGLFLVHSCQGQKSSRFEIVLDKFDEIEVPFDIKVIEDKIEITESEFNDFFNVDPDLWFFDEEYFYYTSVKFELRNGIKALILRRFFESDDNQYKNESVMITYGQNGEVISSVIIHGLHQTDDGETVINGELNSSLELIIMREHYQSNENGEGISKKNSYHYRVNKETGVISSIN